MPFPNRHVRIYSAPVLAQVGVIDPSDVEEARRIVDKALQPAAAEQTDWTCPRCSEVNEGQFGACWSCGTSIPADVDA